MDFPSTGGWAATIAGLVTVISGGLLWLRKWLSGDAVSRAGDGAQLVVIQMLRDELDRSNARNDQLAKALDDSHAQIGELRRQVADLTEEVHGLRLQVRNLGSDGDHAAVA